jgi:outer membrane cobalamin receptor
MNRNNKKLTRLVLSAAIAATFASGVVFAQDAAPAPAPVPAATQDQATPPPATGKKAPAKETTALDAVVVTGNTANGGLRKIDTSYNITTATQEQIRLANPKSTADLLKISPGLWPESTGGQTGANIEIAGFPGGGDAPFNTVQMMGSPLYGMPTLSFFEQTSIFRLDDTVERVEIIQGGPAVVFADGQMGASENFILKTGSDTPEGSVGVTYGNEGLWRADAFYGFKIADKWYGSVGGFYRESDGVRDPQYKADKGGQFTATLKHDFDNGGTLMLYARALNDKNQFITPIPLVQTGTDNFHEYPGFDPLTGTYYSKDIQHVRLPGYPGGGTNANLANGRGAKFNFFGGNYDTDFGDGWHISDKFLIDGGDANTNALFSGTNPASLDDELYNLGSNFGGLQLPAGSATATYKDGSPVAGNQSVIKQGWWYIHKHLRNINNDFRISKEIFEGNTLTAGLYLAHYTDNDTWSQGNSMLMTNQVHAKPVIVSYTQNGQVYQRTDNQGFLDYGMGTANFTESNRATNKAFYLSDSWRSGPWLADLSIRTENIDAANRTCNNSAVDLDGNPNTIYDNQTPVCNGTFNYTHYDKTHTSYTGGLNYEIQSNMSVYVRANKGAHFNDFDNGIRGNGDNPPPMQKIENFEGGFKYQSKYIYADISIYRKIFSGLLFTPTDANGVALVGQSQTYGSASKGVNVQGTVTPIENLSFGVVANYMDGKYSHNTSCLPNTNQVTGEFTCVFINGQQLQRQPKFRYALTPSYRVPFSWGDVTAFVTYSHVGPHTQDPTGLQQLGTYSTVDFAIVANIQDSWQLRLQGTNITNELGLTESNSRIFGTAAGTDGVILARPLEGREINVQAKYFF